MDSYFSYPGNLQRYYDSPIWNISRLQPPLIQHSATFRNISIDQFCWHLFLQDITIGEVPVGDADFAVIIDGIRHPGILWLSSSRRKSQSAAVPAEQRPHGLHVDGGVFVALRTIATVSRWFGVFGRFCGDGRLEGQKLLSTRDVMFRPS